jgi:hypothetical protein
MFPWPKQKVDSWLSLTRPVNPSEMSYPNKNKLFSSANNVSNTLAPHSTHSLSKSADNVPTPPLIPRIIGFEKAQTYFVPLPTPPLVTQAKIGYEESSSPTSDNNSSSHSSNNENDFPRATRQNAFSADSPPHNLSEEQGKIGAQNHVHYEPPNTTTVMQFSNIAESRSINSNLVDIETSTDSYCPHQEKSHASLSAIQKPGENRNELSSENKNEDIFHFHSPQEQNQYAEAIFYFDNSDPHSDQDDNAILNGQSTLENTP